MTSIEQIMGQADHYARGPFRDEIRNSLRELIAAALADARREGAEQMREACARVCDVTPPNPFRPSIEAAHAIRHLPMPTTKEPS